ncbi:uncharacterized protein LOC106081232 [Stomoxys calcitrans]|uniref:uncharacterized protein LOC106081232 n=1 Tax=Stomoxys calcitrans TaxID=35570 RepID=UPI0027E26154|nr:uncharacterized protein LOC106081232 [Stomoxys calcitrans]
MNNFWTILITLTLFCLSLGDAANDDEHFAQLLKETKSVTVEVKSLIEKTLAQLPKETDYDLHRERFTKYLDLYQKYQSASQEDCGEKALEFYDSQNTFFHLYMRGNLKATRGTEVIQLLNENGMQKLLVRIDEERKKGDYDSVNWRKFEEYIAAGHC